MTTETNAVPVSYLGCGTLAALGAYSAATCSLGGLLATAGVPLFLSTGTHLYLSALLHNSKANPGQVDVVFASLFRLIPLVVAVVAGFFGGALLIAGEVAFYALSAGGLVPSLIAIQLFAGICGYLYPFVASCVSRVKNVIDNPGACKDEIKTLLEHASAKIVENSAQSATICREALAESAAALYRSKNAYKQVSDVAEVASNVPGIDPEVDVLLLDDLATLRERFPLVFSKSRLEMELSPFRYEAFERKYKKLSPDDTKLREIESSLEAPVPEEDEAFQAYISALANKQRVLSSLMDDFNASDALKGRAKAVLDRCQELIEASRPRISRHAAEREEETDPEESACEIFACNSCSVEDMQDIAKALGIAERESVWLSVQSYLEERGIGTRRQLEERGILPAASKEVLIAKLTRLCPKKANRQGAQGNPVDVAFIATKVALFAIDLLVGAYCLAQSHPFFFFGMSISLRRPLERQEPRGFTEVMRSIANRIFPIYFGRLGSVLAGYRCGQWCRPIAARLFPS